jgi:hypothetical protein
MRKRRWPRVAAWTVLATAVVLGLGVFAIAKRPVTTPRYPAADWEGQSTQLAGWLAAEDDGSTTCWVLSTGYYDDPDSRTGLVLPDSYRTFAPAIVDRGSGDPVHFIAGTGLWAGAPIASEHQNVTLSARIAGDSQWRADAGAEWSRLCGHIAKVNVVAVVEPGSIIPTD